MAEGNTCRLEDPEADTVESAENKDTNGSTESAMAQLLRSAFESGDAAKAVSTPMR